MPSARFAHTSSVVNGKIYAIGGTAAWLANMIFGDALPTVEEYTPEGWPVSPQPKLPTKWGELKQR